MQYLPLIHFTFMFMIILTGISTCCHERSSGHVAGDVKGLADVLEDGHEVVVAHQCQGEDQVESDLESNLHFSIANQKARLFVR